MKLQHFWKLSTLSITLLIASCSTFSPDSLQYQHMTWNKRQHQLKKVKKWQLTGSIGINNRGKSAIANLMWQQLHNNFYATISAPLNISNMRISSQNNRITIWTSKGQKITTKYPRRFMQREFGWSLPLANLQYWVKGLPAPTSLHKSKFDSYNHLIYLRQQGWNIYYKEFTVINNIDLPSKIFLRKLNSNLWIKLVIRDWNI